MASARPSAALEAYLKVVRRNLRGLPESEIGEVLQELRSHVLDSVGTGANEEAVAGALARLGEPEEIARLNLGTRLAERTLSHRTPFTVLRAIFRLAGLSLRGLWTLIVSLLGYGFAASWLLAALAKPVAPDRVGLWQLASDDLSLSLGVHDAHFNGHEILGWWLVPLGLLIGGGAAYLTYLYDVSAIRRLARRGHRTEERAS